MFFCLFYELLCVWFILLLLLCKLEPQMCSGLKSRVEGMECFSNNFGEGVKDEVKLFKRGSLFLSFVAFLTSFLKIFMEGSCFIPLPYPAPPAPPPCVHHHNCVKTRQPTGLCFTPSSEELCSINFLFLFLFHFLSIPDPGRRHDILLLFLKVRVEKTGKRSQNRKQVSNWFHGESYVT